MSSAPVQSRSIQPQPEAIPARRRSLRASTLALAICVTFVLLLSTYLIRFARPVADDFYRAWEPRAHGLWGAMRKDYLLISGRWLATTLNYTNGRFFDLYRSYPWTLMGCMLVLFGGFYLFIGSILPALSRGKRFAMAATLMAFYWTRMPQPGQTWYWFNGSLEYEFSLGVHLIVSAVLLRIAMGRAPSVGRLIAITICFFIAAGGHELYAAMVLIPLTIGTALALSLRRPERSAWVSAVIGLAVGLGFVAAAPGYRVRAMEYPQSGKLNAMVRYGTSEAMHEIPKWTTDGGLWLATALLLIGAASATPQPQWLFTWFARYPIILLGGWIAVLAAGFYIPAWALGNPIPPRTVTGVYAFFLLGWFLMALTLTQHYRMRLKFERLSAPATVALLEIAFAIALLFGPNVYPGIIDAISRGPKYAREADQRHRACQIAVAQRHLDLTLPPISDWPALSMQSDLASDPKRWENTGFAIYQGLHSVVVIRSDHGTMGESAP